jgi:hypothetical protein
MDRFWSLASIYISLTSFLVTGTILILKGEDLFFAVAKSIIAFIVIYTIQNFFGVMLAAASASETPDKNANQDNLQKQQSQQ